MPPAVEHHAADPGSPSPTEPLYSHRAPRAVALPAADESGSRVESSSATLPVDALPHPPGRLPIVGDVASVDRRRPTQHELQLAQRGLGPIFQRKLLGTQLIIAAALWR